MELLQLQDLLRAKQWDQAKALCRRIFGCSDAPLDELAASFTESGFFRVCFLLEKIRAADPNQRPILGLALEWFVDLDFPESEHRERGLNAARTILAGLPK